MPSRVTVQRTFEVDCSRVSKLGREHEIKSTMQLQNQIRFIILITGITLFTLPVAGYGQSEGQFGWRNSDESYQTRKSESAALRRSLLHTLVPSGVGVLLLATTDQPALDYAGGGLLGYGIMLGPAVGNFYADDETRARRGIGARIASLGAFSLVGLMVKGQIIADGSNTDSHDEDSFYGVMIVTTAITVAGSMVYNIATAPKSAREYNRKLGYSVRLRSLRGTGKTVPLLTARINF